VIDYHTFCELHRLCDADGLSVAQIARILNLDERTVAKWTSSESYQPRVTVARPSKLDPYRADIVRWLHQHPYSAQQIFQRLRQAGYTGGYTILKELVRLLRPPVTIPRQTLSFLPGHCAQVDWGSAGWLQIGSTRRRLSFFVMVLAYSRCLYLEFTLSQTLEHFLACHQNALVEFEGVPNEIWVDNCKTAVLQHPVGGPPTFHPHYLDFARHYGFKIVACAPSQPQQKGRVESAVGYVRKNFLAGLELSSLEAINHAARTWVKDIANVRRHPETQKTPVELLIEERTKLQPLSPQPYAPAVLTTVTASSQCWVRLDTNRYSVPPRYAGRNLTLKAYPERLVVYCDNQPIAEHVRRYDRHQAYSHPEHEQELVAQRRQGRQHQLLMKFMALTPQAEAYHQQLKERRANPNHHVQKIVALSESYGPDKVARALEDALDFHAYSAEYIANILAQRERPPVEPGALHLTRRHDLLDLELPEPDLSIYEQRGGVS